MSPATPMTTPVTSFSAGPIASTASANGSACAVGTEMSTERPSIDDSAVLAVPEPMLANSRRASSWRSLKVLTGFLSVSGRGEGGSGRAGRRALAERVAVHDQGDGAVRQHRAAGERGALGDLGRQRAGHELVLADQARDRDDQARVGGADDHAVVGGRAGDAAQAGAPVDDRQHAVAHD